LRLKLVREEYQSREALKKRLGPRQTAVANTWTSAGPSNGAGRINSIAVHSTAAGTVYIGANSGGVWKTTDGGETWHVSRLEDASRAGVRFVATSFIGNRLGWAVGSGGSIYHTENGGRTWQQQFSGISADLLDVKFLDATEGWAVGAEGTIVHTIDGGRHWTAERSDTEHPLERIFFAGRRHGWAVGFGGTVVAYVGVEAPRLIQ